MMFFATAVSAVLQDWVDAVIILAIVLGSAVLSFVQDAQRSAKTAARRATPKKASAKKKSG